MLSILSFPYCFKKIFIVFISMDQFRADVTKEAEDAGKVKASLDPSKKGWGGKFGVETDRMDKSAVGHDYQAPLVKHASQKDYSTGFGGKYGVQSDRKDKVRSNILKSRLFAVCNRSKIVPTKSILFDEPRI